MPGFDGGGGGSCRCGGVGGGGPGPGVGARARAEAVTGARVGAGAGPGASVGGAAAAAVAGGAAAAAAAAVVWRGRRQQQRRREGRPRPRLRPLPRLCCQACCWTSPFPPIRKVLPARRADERAQERLHCRPYHQPIAGDEPPLPPHLPLRSTDAAAVPAVGAALRPLLDAHLSMEGDQGQQHCCLCCDVH